MQIATGPFIACIYDRLTSLLLDSLTTLVLVSYSLCHYTHASTGSTTAGYKRVPHQQHAADDTLLAVQDTGTQGQFKPYTTRGLTSSQPEKSSTVTVDHLIHFNCEHDRSAGARRIGATQHTKSAASKAPQVCHKQRGHLHCRPTEGCSAH